MSEDDEGFEVSQFACRDCHGTLWARDGDHIEFRCRVGHRYSKSRCGTGPSCVDGSRDG